MERILLITESLGSGGAERQLCGLANSLTKFGYPCRLITYVENQFYEPYLKENNVDYEFVPKLWNKKTRVCNLIKYLQCYKPDVVISFLPSVNISVCLARVFHKCKLIVSERNNNTSVSVKDRVQFNLYRMADYVVPNSYSQGNFINQHFSFLSQKVHPIVNFVDVDKFVPTKNISHNDFPRIITVARYTTQKNCMTFLKAVKIIKEKKLKVHFDWFGSKSFDSAYYSQVEQMMYELGIDDYITLHDSNKDIVVEYQKSDAFCLPSLFEGYPNVVVEAMSCGLPIACSKVFDNPFIVKDGINGFLFNPENPKKIAEALEKLISLSTEDRILMGQRNRESRLKVNSIERFSESYIELIEK